MELKLPVNKNVMVRKLIHSLRNEFSINSESKYFKVVELSVLLIVLSEDQQAAELLDSFVYSEPVRDNEELWTWVCYGLVAAADIARRTGEICKYNSYMEIVKQHDITPSDTSRANYVKEQIDTYKKILSYTCIENKSKPYVLVEDLSLEYIKFLHVRELFYRWEQPSFFTKRYSTKVDSIIERTRTNLLDLLNEFD